MTLALFPFASPSYRLLRAGLVLCLGMAGLSMGAAAQSHGSLGLVPAGEGGTGAEAGGLLSAEELIRPPMVEGGVLQPSGSGALTTPDGESALFSPVGRPPVMGSAPFEEESPREDGPVVMGTDLEAAEPYPALGGDLLGKDYLDPLVERTDPWVFNLEAAVVYDDNIRLSSSNPQQDNFLMGKASVRWQWGDVEARRESWARLFYEATGFAYEEYSGENRIDHDVQAGVQIRQGRMTTALEGRFRRVGEATADLGDRVDRDEGELALAGTLEMGGRTFLEAAAAWETVRYDGAGLTGYDEWLAEFYAGYEMTGRTRVAAGGGLGRLDVEDADHQDFQRIMVKVDRAGSGALTYSATAGAEFRQTGAGDEVTPVYSLSVDWEPVEDSTRLSAELFRDTVASAVSTGENYRRTGVAVRMLQQLGDRFSAGMAAGYEQLSYDSFTSDASSGRTDDYWFARPALKYHFDRRSRAEVFYHYRQDESSLETFSFTASQWGISIGLEF